MKFLSGNCLHKFSVDISHQLGFGNYSEKTRVFERQICHCARVSVALFAYQWTNTVNTTRCAGETDLNTFLRKCRSFCLI